MTKWGRDDTDPSTSSARLHPYRTHDAVVVVPGIMGSELRAVETGAVLWGIDPGSLGRAWLTGSTLRAMRLTEREQQGQYRDVAATRLLRVPSWLPFLRGLEPYTKLIGHVHSAVVDPAAVLEFPYDWRLPVEHNARLLADAAMAHLTRWREHASHEAARSLHPHGRPAKLVMVAHSMGGLLVRHALMSSKVSEEIRSCVTLGTPFHGSPKAVALLNSGKGTVPLPAQRPGTALLRRHPDEGVRALASSLPGVYDLLPTYRCVDDGGAGRRLAVADVVALGGDPEQARAWFDRQSAELGNLVDHQLVVGVAQRTAQSLRIDNGVVRMLYKELGGASGELTGHNRFGDGTVPTGSAELPGVRPTRFAQQHQDLATTDSAIRQVLNVIRERDLSLLGPPMGTADGIGLDVPDVPVVPNVAWTACLTGISNAREATVTVIDTAGGHRARPVTVERREGEYYAPITLPRPGLYRVRFTARGNAPISQLVLAADPERQTDE